jgi:type II secretory pathway predicted ATPase ExeA
MNQPRILPAQATTAPSTSASNTSLEIEDLTRDQRTILSKITQRFREAGVVQVLTGPRESGKSILAEITGRCLEKEAVTVLISKGMDQPPAQKRLVQEAYASYPHMLGTILRQTGFYARGEETDLVEQMVERLRELRQSEKRLLLILDDAQDITPGVWKRMQAWLDYQDRGLRMFQVLLVGSPMLKKMMGEPILRGWRRWTHGSYDLKLLKRGHATEEARRALKRACDVLSLRANTEEPIAPPRMTWFAIRKIASESGGRPGRMYELVRRALSASIRQGGVSITRRFLYQADALRSPTLHPTKVKKAVKAKEKSTETPVPAREETRQPVPQGDIAMRWMRYGLAGLLAVFITGAGWGVHAWLNASAQRFEPVIVEEDSGIEVQEAEPAAPQVTEQTAPVSPMNPAANQVDQFIAQDLAAASNPVPGGDDIWSPLTTGAAPSQVTPSSQEQEVAGSAPIGAGLPVTTTTSGQPSLPGITPPVLSELTLQSSEPLSPVTTITSTQPTGLSGQLPSIQDETIPDVKPETVAAMTLDSPKETEIVNKQPEILRLSGPEKALEQPTHAVETPKTSNSSSKSSGKPRLRKKTLEALAKLEKRLN